MFPLHTWTFCLWNMVANMPHLCDNAFQKPVTTNSILSSQWAHNIICGGTPIMHVLCGVLTPRQSWQPFYLTVVVLQFTDSNSSVFEKCVFHTPSCLVYWLLLVLSHPPYWFIWLYVRMLHCPLIQHIIPMNFQLANELLLQTHSLHAETTLLPRLLRPLFHSSHHV